MKNITFYISTLFILICCGNYLQAGKYLKRIDSLHYNLASAESQDNKLYAYFMLANYYNQAIPDSFEFYSNKMKYIGKKENPGKLKAFEAYLKAIETLNKGNIPGTKKLLDSAIKLNAIKFDQRLEGRIYNTYIFILVNKEHHLEEAEGKIRYIIPKLKKIKSQELINKVYNLYGGIYTQKADLNGELKVRNELVSWNKSQKDTVNLAFAYNNIAMLYSYKGYFKESIPLSKLARKLFFIIGDSSFVGNTYMNNGSVYSSLGQYDEALKEYLEGLKFYKKLNYKEGIAGIYANMGTIYEALKNYKDAKKNYLFAVKEYDVAKNYVNSGIVLNLLGNIYLVENNPEEAKKTFQKALSKAEKANHQSGIANTLINMGNIDLSKKENKSALSSFIKARDIYKSLIEKDGLCVSLLNISSVKLEQGKVNEAIKNAEESLRYAEEMKSKKYLHTAYNVLSQAYSKAGRYQDAFRTKDLAYNLRDSILNYDKANEMGKMEANYIMKLKLEKERQEKIAKLKAEEQAAEYKNSIEYTGILLFVAFSALIIYIINKKHINVKHIDKYILFVFLISFEFLIMIVNSPLERFTNDDTILNLLLSIAIAVSLTPFHDRLHNYVTKKININKITNVETIHSN